MVRREVNQPLISYRDPEGRIRHALQGEGVDVDDEWLEGFDAANGFPQSRPKKQARPKQQARPRRT
jgi:hypothetical protein